MARELPKSSSMPGMSVPLMNSSRVSTSDNTLLRSRLHVVRKMWMARPLMPREANARRRVGAGTTPDPLSIASKKAAASKEGAASLGSMPAWAS